MTLSDRISKIAQRDKTNEQISFDLNQWTNLLSLSDEFSSNYSLEIFNTVNNNSTPSSEAVNAMMEVLGLSEQLSDKVRGTYSKGDVIKIAESINRIRDTYETVFSSFSLTGKSETPGFSTKHLYDEYIIPKGHSLARVAEDLLGSRENLNILLEDNPELINMTQSELAFRKIKIRNDNKRGASIASNDGDESWGIDLPNSLEIENGDLKVLTPRETIIQGTLNILLYGTHSVPEDRLFGNMVVDLIGRDRYSISPAIAIKTLRDTLTSDPSIDSAEIQKFIVEGDKTEVKISITPINSNETIDIIL